MAFRRKQGLRIDHILISDALKPRLGGLQPQQLLIYEAFSRLKAGAVHAHLLRRETPAQTG